MALDPTLRTRLAALAAGFDGLRLLALHGSRARGDGHAGSDWDFALLGTATLDRDGLRLALVDALATEAVDLADLEAASAVLRWQVAKEGVLVHADDVEMWHAFRCRAVDYWCDNGPVIRAAQDALLAGMAEAGAR